MGNKDWKHRCHPWKFPMSGSVTQETEAQQETQNLPSVFIDPLLSKLSRQTSSHTVFMHPAFYFLQPHKAGGGMSRL